MKKKGILALAMPMDNDDKFELVFSGLASWWTSQESDQTKIM
jgi:hypothetical protein